MNEQKATETPFTQKTVSESDIFIHSRCTTVHSKISFFYLNKSVTASLYLPGVQWSLYLDNTCTSTSYIKLFSKQILRPKHLHTKIKSDETAIEASKLN